ncbi:MAG: hypothetical protein JNL76_07550 [Alphaproteobacteria bacterium]|nr:hypothetical protein [Alphaproteobacteria bacterium]
MSQFNFNIMDAAGYGFYRVWGERVYLLKLATIPLLIKFACMIAVMVLEIEGNILRQGLILFPGVLAEGWVLAQFLRTLLKGERWPTILPADIDDKILDKLLMRARGIVAATLAYGLISLALYMIRYLAFGLMLGDFQATHDDVSDLLARPELGSQEKADMNPWMIFPLLLSVVGLLWGFRLLWVYIPLSILMPVDEYLTKIRGIMTSVKMIILYFCTMVPVMFVLIVISRLVFGISEGILDNGESVARFIMLFFAVIADTVVWLVSTAAFVWAMKDFLPKMAGGK